MTVMAATSAGRAERAGHARSAGSARPTGPAGSNAGLSIEGVSVVYEPDARGAQATTAVRAVSLDVLPGQIMALLGASGCGKSSLLRAVAGIEPLAAGAVSWDGRDLAGVPIHRRGFGLMFQDGQLFPHRTVAGNIAYGLRGPSAPAGMTTKAARTARVMELLDLVGLAGYHDRPVTTLSGGETQRVALARCLAPEPALLLLDEPLSALDRSLRERLAGELRDVLLATGTTALFVTHDHDEAFTVADRVAIMSGGSLLQVGAPAELWRHPVSEEVARFLGYEAFLPMEGAVRAVAPGAFAILENDSAGPGELHASSSGVSSVGGADRPEAAAGRWVGVVVGSAFRKSHTEVLVDVQDLGVVTVHAGPMFGGVHGDVVRLRLDDGRTTTVG